MVLVHLDTQATVDIVFEHRMRRVNVIIQTFAIRWQLAVKINSAFLVFVLKDTVEMESAHLDAFNQL